MMTHYPIFIKALTSLGLAYAIFQTFQNWQQYNQLAVISTAMVHLPMAIFGTVCAFGFIVERPVFSFVSAAFVWLNAVLV